MVFDCLKNKLLGAIQPAGKTASFKAEWNQIDPNFILLGSQVGKSFILYCKDYKNMQITNSIFHNSEVFGVAWNPMMKEEYAVGCKDGTVQLCDMNRTIPDPQKILKGHGKRVFHVCFNPQIPDILATGSDDLTIFVWNIRDQDHAKILRGHQNNVRAIAFNPELPWMLISGSWDATIKLWDIRSATCIYTITEHQADIYGITFHPQRPFSFITSSRDTTIRFWSLEQLVTTLRL
jgi:WD40 repeat protein